MVKKTRDRFIEVARSLFARKGVENTTMNDIAAASDKGRRTIYTYFKSKREIFNAVIETETDDLLRNLRIIVSRNGSLRAGFFRDVRKVDRARNLISKKEIVFLMRILTEGVESGDFDIPDVKEWAILITNSINGMDVPYIRDSLTEYGVDKEKIKIMLADLILNGIKVR